MSRQNEFESGPFRALTTCTNEAVGSETKVQRNKRFLLFFIQQKVPRGCPRKMCFFAYIITQKGSKLQGKKMQNIVKTPKQNCMRNLERFWQSSILRKIPNALFPPNPSIRDFSDFWLLFQAAHIPPKSGCVHKLQSWKYRGTYFQSTDISIIAGEP